MHVISSFDVAVCASSFKALSSDNGLFYRDSGTEALNAFVRWKEVNVDVNSRLSICHNIDRHMIFLSLISCPSPEQPTAA